MTAPCHTWVDALLGCQTEYVAEVEEYGTTLRDTVAVTQLADGTLDPSVDQMPAELDPATGLFTQFRSPSAEGLKGYKGLLHPEGISIAPYSGP